MAKTKEFEIDAFSYTVANEAIKDILFMYYCMDDFEGFGDAETGTFNPYWFLKTRIAEKGFLSESDVTLLQNGASVKILNWIADEVFHHPIECLSQDHWSNELLDSKALSRVPEAESTIRAAYENNSKFEEALSNLYSSYVREWFITHGRR